MPTVDDIGLDVRARLLSGGAPRGSPPPPPPPPPPPLPLLLTPSELQNWGVEVQGFGFLVLGFRVWGSELRIEGFRVSGFRFWGLGLRGSGFRA